MTNLKDNQFFRFCLVGTAGFCVDGGLLQAGIHLLDQGPIVARIPSFAIAVLVTWYLNRSFTFRAPEKEFKTSFPSYIAANTIGLALNFGIYSAGILFSPILEKHPLAALAIGAVIGLLFNFMASKFWVFKRTES